MPRLAIWLHLLVFLRLVLAQDSKDEFALDPLRESEPLEPIKRTNFASSECAASIVKTNPVAKNVKNVLLENKDTYAMFECSASGNFIIIELCQDILVDSIVISNYEFFSSLFKDVSISVSDRYPADADKWQKLGDFQTNNTREDQTFVVHSPLIWSRYVRVDLLSHWGSEFYCPLTSVRIYGTTMMDKYKQHDPSPSAAKPSDDSSAEIDGDLTECVEAPVCSETPLCPDLPNNSDVSLRALPEFFPPDTCLPRIPHPQSRLLCAALKRPISPLEIRMCCVNVNRPLSPTSSASSSSAESPAASPSSPSVQESIYEAIINRIGTLETTAREHTKFFSGQNQAIQEFLGQLNETLISDLLLLSREKNQLQQTVEGLSSELSYQRKGLFLQTGLLGCIFIYITLRTQPGRPARSAATQRTASWSQLKHWARNARSSSTFSAASDDEYMDPDFSMDPGNEDDDTYSDSKPPLFTPSGGHTPQGHSRNPSDQFELLPRRVPSSLSRKPHSSH